MHVRQCKPVMVCKPCKPAPSGGAKKPNMEPRIDEQRRVAKAIWSELKSDAKLAAIMLNPIFAPHANAITLKASARAIERYETEVPRKSLNTLMKQEQAKARQEILGLPALYAETGAVAARKVGEGAQLAGALAVAGAVAAGGAVRQGADIVVDGATDTTGKGLTGLGGVFARVADFLTGLGRRLTD